MNIDIRVKNDFFFHPKTRKLERLLGECAPLYVIKIWVYASRFFPNGILKDVDDEFLESEVGWLAKHESGLIEALVNIGFIERGDGCLVLHDWEEHNTWAVSSEIRNDKGRFSRLKQLLPDVYSYLQGIGIIAISKEQYQKITKSEEPLKESQKLFPSKKSGVTPKNPTGNPTGSPRATPNTDPRGTPGVLHGSNTNTNTNTKKEENIPPTCVGGTPPPMPEAKYIAFAERFQKEVIMLKGKPKAPKLTDALIRAGAASLDKAVRLDNADWEELQNALIWAVTDDFWSDQVLSLAQIRTKSKNGVFKYVNILSSYQKAKMREEKANNYQIAMN